MRLCVVNAIAPPAAGSRAERTLHLASAWIRLGGEVTVLRAHLPSGYPLIDAGLGNAMDRSGARIATLAAGWPPAWRYPARAREATRPLLRAAAQAVWPDVWVRFALEAARWVRRHRDELDLIVTSAQPWSDHVAGHEAARSCGLPWIADYGDPWSLIPTRRGWVRSPEFPLESRLLRLVSGAVVTTEPTRRLFVRMHRLPQESVRVIPAGVPWRPLAPPPPSPAPPTILHAGTVYGARGSAGPFADAVDRYRRAGRPLRVVWFGSLWRDQDARAILRTADVVEERATSDEVGTAEAEAHVVLILGNRGGIQVPGKVWRALGTGRPLLVIQADENDPLRSLPELRDRAVFCDNDAASIVRGIEACVARLPDWPFAATSRPRDLPSWEQRARDLGAFADECVARQRSARVVLPRSASFRLPLIAGTACGLRFLDLWTRRRAARGV